jgi:hypothetical protein
LVFLFFFGSLCFATRGQDASPRAEGHFEATLPMQLARKQSVSIATKFSQGDFAIPMFIHATVPPGVETMKRLKSEIMYAAENTARSAQLRITTCDAEAVAAIHRLPTLSD